jgi:F-type H+-transporting ATPase subunit delta
MKSSKSAVRYAQALLDLAIENNSLDVISSDMKYFDEVASSSREFELLLSSPIVRADKKINVFNAVFEQFNPITLKFIELITKNGRENVLPQIAQSFDVLLKAFKGIVPITIISAAKLNETTRKEIISKVQSTLKGSLEVTEEIDTALIGGFIVKMGDKRIDASVASQLTKLKQNLSN